MTDVFVLSLRGRMWLGKKEQMLAYLTK